MRGFAHLLMLASGFAGLGYQIVWTRQSVLWLGHETAAVLAVVAAFFGGLALGAIALGSRVARAARPERWYAGCELAIAGWSLALALLLGPAAASLLALTGAEPSAWRQWTVAFAGTFLLLLPATAAMGATLPAMDRVVARLGGARERIAALYAANTLGATLGVLATAFWLVPTFGLARTAMACAALNVACALGVPWLRRTPGPVPTVRLPAAARPGRAAGTAPVAVLAATGLLGIGYEVLVVRVLGQATENTVYTFALLLAVYLVGTALGAAAYHARHARRAPAEGLRTRLLALQAAACLAGTATLWWSADLHAALAVAAGSGVAAALAAETTLAVAAFALPTLAMGALFAHLCNEAQDAGIPLGRALGANLLGSAAAPPLVGVLLATWLGPKGALLAVAGGYLLLALPRAVASPLAWTTAAATVALAALAPPLASVDVPPGGRVAFYRDGALGAVSVVEDADGVARLRIDNRAQEGSSATRYSDGRLGLLPLLLHPAPGNALFLGLGTGVTASVAAATGTDVTAVELLPDVIAASGLFATDGAPRPRAVVADARRYVRTAKARYDVIVADNFHPARSGAGALYTVEHFRAVRARLATDGVFCQWLPLHQLDLDTLRTIVGSFLVAFPDGTALLATHSLETPVLGLVGRAAGGGFDAAALDARRAAVATAVDLRAYGLDDDLAVLGAFVAGPTALARFAVAAPLNTDDRPVVAYRAPRATYAPEARPSDRLVALAAELDARPDELLGAAFDESLAVRLAAWWSARDRFLAAGRDVRASPDPHAMLAQVREPLLDVLRISPEFMPAYEPLLRLALALAPSDPATARPLLLELARLQPARPEPATALAALGAHP